MVFVPIFHGFVKNRSDGANVRGQRLQMRLRRGLTNNCGELNAHQWFHFEYSVV